MLLFRRSDELPAALDAGSDTVKLLQLARCPGGLRVVAAARQSQSETGGPALPRLSAILRRMRIDAPFTTRRVIAAMPGEIVHFRTLRVAPADAREIDRARFEGHLREEAARQFPFDLDCASVRFLHAGPVRQGGMERQEAIAVAVKNADIAAFVDQLHEGGLRPVALWPGPLAAYWWGAGERQRPGLGARWWGRHSCLPSDSSADKNGCLTASASPSPSPGTPGEGWGGGLHREGGRTRTPTLALPRSTGGGNKSGRRNCHAPDKNVSPTPASYRAIVDIGAAATVVAIMSGGQLTFIKSIAIGGRHFNQAVSRSLGLGSQEVRELRRHFSAQAGGNEAMRQGAACAVFDATRGSMEELAHRVAACFRYQAITFPGRQPKQVFLVGGEAADPNLLAALTPALPVTPVALDPLEGVDCSAMKPADCQSPRGQWSVAAAISRCAGLQSIGADLDFLPCIRLRSWRWPGLSAA